MEKEIELKTKITEFDEKHMYFGISSLIKDKDEFKLNYFTQLKKSQQIKVVLDSQKKSINFRKADDKFNKTLQSNFVNKLYQSLKL